MKNNKITYLLGAGASSYALPLIKSKYRNEEGKAIKDSDKGLSECLKDFLLQHKNEWASVKVNDVHQRDKEMERILFKLENIANECINFGTPDLYAKFLYESSPNKDEDYLLLKLLLSNFFYFKQYSDSSGRQLGKELLDKRALTFLSTICDSGKLPENVRIISWNYDEQIEIAGSKINTINGINFLPSWPNQNADYKGHYFIQHLNGIAGWDYIDKAIKKEREFITYKNFSNLRNPLLSFAWEKRDNHKLNMFFDKRFEVLQSMINDTNIFVIIGYSFPFFNRKIDKMIFEYIGSNAKIYYQDPNAKENIKIIKSLFGLKNDIEPITYTEQYFVPFEL